MDLKMREWMLAKENTILSMSVFMLLIAGYVFSGCGSSDELQCGYHQSPVDGICVCNEGFAEDENGNCIKISDGDTDFDIDEEIADQDKTDGDDADTDDVEYVEVDGVTDGDLDDDTKEEEQNCYCPVGEGTFCIDPEISNPAGYYTVQIIPGNDNCTLKVVVKNDKDIEMFNGELRCKENGRVDIASIQCELDFDVADKNVKLVCDQYQYNFSFDFCAVADGDEDEEVEIADIDQEDDIDADGDADSDGVVDGDTETDGDIDITDNDIVDADDDVDVVDGDTDVVDGDDDNVEDMDSDPEPECTTSEECPAYWYCNYLERICVEGYCNPTSDPPRNCPSGYECDSHGVCNIIVADVDPDEDVEQVCQCTDDESCDYGYHCSDCKCVNDCWYDTQCEENEECYVPRGICILSGIETCDYLNNVYCEDPCKKCTESNTCVAGCCSNNDCAECQVCEHGRCEADPLCGGDADADTDEEVQTCTTNEECPMGEYCKAQVCDSDCLTTASCIETFGEGYICTERGLCSYVGVCTVDQDCKDLGKDKHFCSNGECLQDCATDDYCIENLCPPYCVCGEWGYCEEGTPVDGDEEDGEEVINCTADDWCPHGLYCNTETRICIFDCTNDDECEGNDLCDESTGKCQVIIDGDVEVDDAPVATDYDCTIDEDCTAVDTRWRCQIVTNYCVNLCDYCEVGYSCDANGNCTCNPEDPCASVDGDDEVEIDYDINQPCGNEGDPICPQMYYCDQGQCVTECLPNCPDGYFCHPTEYRCYLEEDGDSESTPECIDNNGCEQFYHCDMNTYTCVSECDNIGNECPSNLVCTDNGECVPDYHPCVNHSECPQNNYCDNVNWVCQYRFCNGVEDCADGEICSGHGSCEEPGYVDEFPTCTIDDDCPNYSHCVDGTCVSDCMAPAINCAEGFECSLDGICTEIVIIDGDEELDVEVEEEIDEVNPDESFACYSNEECPYNSNCSFNGELPDEDDNEAEEPPRGECLSSCFTDFHCSGGLQCDCLGQCVVDASQTQGCDGFYQCFTDEDCGGVAYCSGGFCRIDCKIGDSLLGCPPGEACQPDGHCVEVIVDGDDEVDLDPDVDPDIDPDIEEDTAGPDMSCSAQNECPYHTDCNMSTLSCEAECLDDRQCYDPEKPVCNNRGVCVTSDAVWDDGLGYPPCTVDSDCRSIEYCDENNHCRIDCIEEGDYFCETGFDCVRGKCIPLK